MAYYQRNERNQFAARSNGRQHRLQQRREGSYMRNGYQGNQGVNGADSFTGNNGRSFHPTSPPYYFTPSYHSSRPNYHASASGYRVPSSQGVNGYPSRAFPPQDNAAAFSQPAPYAAYHGATFPQSPSQTGNAAALPPPSTSANAAAAPAMIPGLPATLAPLLASSPRHIDNALAALQTLRTLTKAPVNEAEQKRLAEEKEKEREEREKREARQKQITLLYAGKQCASCGLRVKKELVSKHMDDHFRQNQQKNRSSRIRGWFMDDDNSTPDQQQAGMPAKTKSKKIETCATATEEGESDDPCEMCHEEFQSRWNEDEEQWELQNAMRVEGRAIHPDCFDDKRKQQ